MQHTEDAPHPTDPTHVGQRRTIRKEDGGPADASHSHPDSCRARDDEDERVARSFSVEDLVQARASVSVIVKKMAAAAAAGGTDGHGSERGGGGGGGGGGDGATMLQRLARVVDAEWNRSQPSHSNGEEEVEGQGAEANGDDDGEDSGAASRRYLRRLLEKIVSDHEVSHPVGGEEDGSGALDELYAVWATMVACPWRTSISERASSAVTFRIPKELVVLHREATRSTDPADQDEHLVLRFRTYPYHNDVSLRLWEAGTVLAELLATDRALSELVRNRCVVELGSGGIGLTGAVALGCCGASRFLSTDVSTPAILNLRHNIGLNCRAFPAGAASAWECLCYDWNDALRRSGDADAESPTLARLSASDVLLAADVAYDDSAIPGLVETFRLFFASGTAPPAIPNDEPPEGGGGGGVGGSQLVGDNAVNGSSINSIWGGGFTAEAPSAADNKVAILAVTRRRRSTFDALMRRLRSRLLDDSGSNSGEQAGTPVQLEQILGRADEGDTSGSSSSCCSPPPPVLFPTHFVQPRSDVAVFLLRSNSNRSRYEECESIRS